MGFNDLASRCPDLALQWDYEKNYPLKPDEILFSTSKKVWWKCDKGHTWQTSVYLRQTGRGCPYCTHQKHGLIYCEENCKTYLHYEDVALDLRVSVSSVSAVLNGKRKSAKGYHLRFLGES